VEGSEASQCLRIRGEAVHEERVSLLGLIDPEGTTLFRKVHNYYPIGVV
jgi:hypothetical protein